MINHKTVPTSAMSEDSQWWASRLSQCTIEVPEKNTDPRILLLHYHDGKRWHLGEMTLLSDGTWIAESV